VRLDRQVTVRRKRRASGAETVVKIDHRLSCDLDAHAGWHIRTRQTLLPRAHFSSWAIAHIKNAERSRGRAIYCHDSTAQEVIAAPSYHIDEDSRMPILITTLAFRTDTEGNPIRCGRFACGHRIPRVGDGVTGTRGYLNYRGDLGTVGSRADPVRSYYHYCMTLWGSKAP